MGMALAFFGISRFLDWPAFTHANGGVASLCVCVDRALVWAVVLVHYEGLKTSQRIDELVDDTLRIGSQSSKTEPMNAYE